MKLLLALLLLAQTHRAHAGPFAGAYKNSAACSFSLPFTGQVDIPAGKLVVTENVPYRPNLGDQPFPAILFQSNDNFEAVLALPIGKYVPFAFGVPPSAEGRYARPYLFEEQYLSGGKNSAVDGVIVLQASDNSLELKVSDGQAQPLVCHFEREFGHRVGD